MEYNDDINNLLALLAKRNELEIQDYYIVRLLQNIIYKIVEDEYNQEYTFKINVDILRSYLNDCENDRYVVNGLIITSSGKRMAIVDNYIVGLKELIGEMCRLCGLLGS